MDATRRREQNRRYKQERHEFGVCERCYRDAYVNPRTGKVQTLCEVHRQEQIDSYQAKPKDREALRAKYRKWNKSRASTPRVYRYLKSLYAELDRLKELDAAGDVQSLLFYRDASHGTTPTRRPSALQDVPATGRRPG